MKKLRPETVGERFARRLNEGIFRTELFLFKRLIRDEARKYWAAHVVWNEEHYLMWSDDGEKEMAGPFEDPGEFQVIHHNGKPIFIASRGCGHYFVLCGADNVAGPFFDPLVDLCLTGNQSITFTEHEDPSCDYGRTNHHTADISGFYR